MSSHAITGSADRSPKCAELQFASATAVTPHETITTMRRSYKFLLRPTSRQADALNRQLALHCEVYNAALQERRDAWRSHGKSVVLSEQCKQLTEVRMLRPDVGELYRHSVALTLRQLDRTFAAFFRRVKAGEKPGYPRFRSVKRFHSMSYCCAKDVHFQPERRRIRLQGIGEVRVHQHRPLPDGAVLKTTTIKREGKRWYVIFSCDQVPTVAHAATGSAVGVDLGIATLLTTSDGEQIANPRHGANGQRKLGEAQRVMCRRKKGSNRRRKAAARVGRHNVKVRNQRLDTAHKLALDLVRRHDLVAHEALNLPNMTRSMRGKPAQDGRQVAAKSGLNRSILDAGWGVFLKVLRDKAEWAGREVISVNPANTSRRCAQCGHTAAENRVTQAEFRCQACGHTAHADVNAAINILRAGLALREVAA